MLEFRKAHFGKSQKNGLINPFLTLIKAIDLSKSLWLVLTIMVDIVDIGMGNVRSIHNVLSRLGLESNIVSRPESLSSHTLILPGVGSASPFMKKLHSTKLDCSIREHVNRGNKLIGICLGFQVMTLFSEEDGGTSARPIVQIQFLSIVFITM